MPSFLEFGAATGGATVLPDERVVDRLAGLAVPGDDRLALVGDPDRVETVAVDAGPGERPGRDRPCDLPDLLGVMLDPAGLGEVLVELGVAAAGDPPLPVEHERGGTGGALVDGEDHLPALRGRRDT